MILGFADVHVQDNGYFAWPLHGSIYDTKLVLIDHSFPFTGLGRKSHVSRYGHQSYACPPSKKFPFPIHAANANAQSQTHRTNFPKHIQEDRRAPSESHYPLPPLCSLARFTVALPLAIPTPRPRVPLCLNMGAFLWIDLSARSSSHFALHSSRM